MNKPPVLLLYGLDEASHPYEVEGTRLLVQAAEEALRSRGWHLETIQLAHDLVSPLKPYDPHEWIVLNLCEGSPAQEFYYARVARLLGSLDYTFSGSDYRCLDQTQYKVEMKLLLQQADVSTPQWAIFNTGDEVNFSVYPAIVKPASEHCSMGITRHSVVLNVEEARRQVASMCAEFSGPALVEEFLDSPEYNVSVWGGDARDAASISVLGISTMTYDAFDDIHDRLCTFEAKWDPESTAYQRIPAICPAPLSPQLEAVIERVSIAAYQAAGCRDYGRIDLRLRGEQPMVLDINANCDVSPGGGFANAAAAAKLSYAEMLEQIVEFAIQRRDNAMALESVRFSPDSRVLRGIPAVAG